MSCSKSTVKATGLNIWYDGTQDHDEPKVDVIAVQGLGADPYYTWVWKQDSANKATSTRQRPFDFLQGRGKNAQAAADGLPSIPQSASGAAESETMWLRDLLPSFIPHARIATYSYESDWRRAEVKTSVRKCGQQLLNILLQNRSGEKESRRPLVFVGHSLGGLIIKQALVIANHGGDFNDIRLSTAGIVFLGTPHHGSDAAVYGMWLAQAVRHDKMLLKCLQKNSSALDEIAQDFEMSYRDADIVCFYENKETAYGPWQTQLVVQQSATLHGRRMIFLTTDHSGLNKFFGPKDSNFSLVWPEIQRMTQTAPSKIDAKCSSQTMISKKNFRISFSLKGIPVMSKFVARDAEMNHLKQELLPTSVRRRVFVLHGLGGIGKTQLSVEFAQKYQTSYSAIIWIKSSTKERIRQSITDLASRLPQDQVSEKIKSYLKGESSDVDEVVNEVLKWLSQPSNDQWLLIFDNVDQEFSVLAEDPEAFDINLYFPQADQGSILVTTRLASLWRLGTDLKLEPVDELQGENILKNSIGYSVKDSTQLIELLHGLPLAINQAGSYMRETGTNVAEYIKLYNHAWKKLMKRSREDVNGSVLTTWTLSFSHLRAQSQEAANLLLLWGFLDNQDLWYGLFAPALNQEIFDEMPDWFVKCAADEFDFKDCIGLLLKYSFIDAKTESSSFSVHPVFHHWCFHAFEEDKAIMSKLATIIVASAVPSDTMPDHTLTQRRLLPHCDCILSLAQQRMQKSLTDEIDFQWQSDAYHKLGGLYLDQKKMKKSEDMYLRALAGKEKIWGAEHTSTLDTVNNLANLYKNQDRMKEAENLYLRALAGTEKAWSAEHTSTLDTVNNLALLYSDQGRMEEAENLYLRALAGYEKAWGAEHTSTLSTVNNLANLYINQGRIEEAENLYLRALAGKEKAWGAEHTSTLDTVNNLANLYFNQGRMEEAENLYLRALAGYEKAWGAEHTSTLKTVNNLALLYSDQGNMEEAENLYLRALAGKEKAWGAEHTSTLDTVDNLANLYFNQGRMEEAENLYLRALAGYEKTWGGEHKKSLGTRYNLAILYQEKNQVQDATEQLELVVQGYTKVLGPDHEKTIEASEQIKSCKTDRWKVTL